MIGLAAQFMGSLLTGWGAPTPPSDAPAGDGGAPEGGFASELAFWTAPPDPNAAAPHPFPVSTLDGSAAASSEKDEARLFVPASPDGDADLVSVSFEAQGAVLAAAVPVPSPLAGPQSAGTIDAAAVPAVPAPPVVDPSVGHGALPAIGFGAAGPTGSGGEEGAASIDVVGSSSADPATRVTAAPRPVFTGLEGSGPVATTEDPQTRLSSTGASARELPSPGAPPVFSAPLPGATEKSLSPSMPGGEASPTSSPLPSLTSPLPTAVTPVTTVSPGPPAPMESAAAMVSVSAGRSGGETPGSVAGSSFTSSGAAAPSIPVEAMLASRAVGALDAKTTGPVVLPTELGFAIATESVSTPPASPRSSAAEWTARLQRAVVENAGRSPWREAGGAAVAQEAVPPSPAVADTASPATERPISAAGPVGAGASGAASADAAVRAAIAVAETSAIRAAEAPAQAAADPTQTVALDDLPSTAGTVVHRVTRPTVDGPGTHVDAPSSNADPGAAPTVGGGAAAQGDQDPSASSDPRTTQGGAVTGTGPAENSADALPSDLGARLRSAVAESIVRTGRDRLLASAQTRIHTRIRVQPAELGALQIDLRRHEDATLDIRVTTAHQHAREALKGEMDELVHTLQRHRIEVGDVQLRHDADLRSGGESRDGTPRQDPGQRTPSESAARERTGADRNDPEPERRSARRRPMRWPAGNSKRLDVEA